MIALPLHLLPAGGLRDPLNPWDYFNPTHDGKNRIDDVTAVIRQYRVDRYLPSPPNPPNTLNPAYRQDTDRTLPLGAPYPWSLGPPDGKQRIDDVVNIIRPLPARLRVAESPTRGAVTGAKEVARGQSGHEI